MQRCVAGGGDMPWAAAGKPRDMWQWSLCGTVGVLDLVLKFDKGEAFWRPGVLVDGDDDRCDWPAAGERPLPAGQAVSKCFGA